MPSENGFYLNIVSRHGNVKTLSSNYVEVFDGSTYEIELGNNRNTECMVTVYIDGKNVGTWFVPAKDRIVIEKPANISKNFLFISETNPDASFAGVIRGTQDNGIVRAVFKPKLQYPSFSPQFHSSLVSSGYNSGATVLGNDSDQLFNTKRPYRREEIDYRNNTEIIVRLMAPPRSISYTDRHTDYFRPSAPPRPSPRPTSYSTRSPPRSGSYTDRHSYSTRPPPRPTSYTDRHTDYSRPTRPPPRSVSYDDKFNW